MTSVQKSVDGFRVTSVNSYQAANRAASCLRWSEARSRCLFRINTDALSSSGSATNESMNVFAMLYGSSPSHTKTPTLRTRRPAARCQIQRTKSDLRHGIQQMSRVLSVEGDRRIARLPAKHAGMSAYKALCIPIDNLRRLGQTRNPLESHSEEAAYYLDRQRPSREES